MADQILIEKLIKEAIDSDFKCIYCSGISCDCDSEAGEPDGF